MKLTCAAALAAISMALTLPVHAAMGHDHGANAHAASPAAAPMSQTLVDGVVKKVDKPSGKVTVSHGPLPNGMPGMTMAFPVAKSVSIDQLKEGQKIRFALDDPKGVLTIVRVEPAK